MAETLTEKYRPSQWSDVIGQNKVVGRIQALAKRGALSWSSILAVG
jgi:DNA polymerase III gamma/tau subunit